jgi:hypothetical protein
MIRKPPSGWQGEESAALKSVRSAAGAAHRGAHVARRGGHAARGLFCFFLAAIWGFAALAGGLIAGDIITFVCVGAMAALMAWAGRRAFAKARQLSG